MKICPICEELVADEVNICKNCGFSFNVTKKVVETPIHKPKEKVRPRNNRLNRYIGDLLIYSTLIMSI